MPLHPTTIALPEPTRADVLALIDKWLADCIDLRTQAHHTHRNVNGSHFTTLHELFDEIRERIGVYASALAERAVQLGGMAEGTVHVGVARSSTTEDLPTVTSERDTVAALSDALAEFGKRTRHLIAQANESGDAATAGVLADVSFGIDKWLWMLESHLDEDGRFVSSTADQRGASVSGTVTGNGLATPLRKTEVT